MANINRDYLIINDVKKSNVKLDNGSIFFYITDKNTQNIFVNLVINISNNDLIQKYANIENAEDYTLTMNIVKPDNTYKIIEGKLHDKEKAIFEFNLNEDCCDEIGTYRCELLTKCNINDHEEITTSNKLTYKVKSSVLNDLDEIVEAPEYPLVIQLFDKLSDIEQYEEDRRANELARQLAEEQRQAKHNELVSDMTNNMQTMDDKVVDVENRIAAKEQAVDTLIVNTKADIDNYKVAKDQEIDEYKATKDTEINNAITAQDNKINEFINERNDRLNAIEAKNTEQDNRLDVAENRLANIGNDITNTMQPIIDGHTARLDNIEAIDVAQNSRLDAIEVKNQQQDDRLLDIEKVNKKQDVDIKCLYGASQTIDVTKEGNSIYLQNSNNGFVAIDEIKGNTLVNCNKEPDKELILNGNINTSGDNTVTLTEGVDGGLVDVSLEGNTLVNVSKTKDSTAITNAYTVENSGDHIALQGDVDGNCRPVITGKTLWIDNDTEEILTAFDGTKNLRLQSTFEDNLVTQEMVDSGEEVADNLGKYRVDYRVTGKNKFDINLINPKYAELTSTGFIVRKTTEWAGVGITHFKLKKHTDYIFNFKALVKSGKANFTIRDDATNTEIKGISIILPSTEWVEKKLTWNSGDRDKIALYFYSNFSSSTIDEADVEFKDIQIEEGDTATSYEPYKEYTKTLYLNSPLLEGNTIEEKDNGIYHVHRSELVAYTEGDETSLITDKVNTLHQLETPTYELIEQSNLVIPSYTNGHLDFDTTVPVEKVDFLPFSEGLTYLYANTQYTVQFVSDKAVTIDITLGGTQLLAQNIVAGLNRIAITTPATLVDNKLVISGVGANISEVVVTDTDREFGYFEGMKSVGEGKELQVISINSERKLVNTQTLTHEPLRAVGDVKDRYVLIDGKWYIERNCATFTLNSKNGYSLSTGGWENKTDVCTFEGYKPTPTAILDYAIRHYTDTLPSLTFSKQWEESGTKGMEGIAGHPIGGFCLSIKRSKLKTQDINGLDEYLRNNPIKVTYQTVEPTYEPINYNPLEVYSDITHITTNSTIPTNIIVKNHGFNCLLKPSTTYTVSSNLGLNTVTTPSTLTEDCLRFMDTDTSDVTTMKNVLVLEGDWTTKADLIPANFSGIESAFEQEYDAEKGKYKVNVKVANEDKSQENNITFYINEPLRGTDAAKDKVYIKDAKVVVQRNCGIRPYEDGDFGTYLTDKVDTVYPLAEPIYEEVEYNDTKLFIESFKNSTLSYNSNVPVTSKLYYSYSVPIVDTVAQTASISDEQDNMIIELATQVAVMEMMLM